jgi:hypothetical protein
MHSSQSSEISSSTSNAAATDRDAVTTDLYFKLKSAPEKTQLQIVQALKQAGEAGLTALMQFLQEWQASESNGGADVVAGAAYQVLFSADAPQTQEFLQTYLPQGIVPLRSAVNLDYLPLQQLLAEQDFLAADKFTLQKLCELAGPTAVQRKWIYFTEVDQFPIEDLQTINALWLVHSEGRFGFSAQREIWLSVGKDWEKLWAKIGWKTGNNWTRYPQEFTWNLTAPRGHLPLSNQLRGVRVIAALLMHPAWSR